MRWLVAIREQQPTYTSSSRWPSDDESATDPAYNCGTLLEQLFCGPGQEGQAAGAFFAWATAKYDWPPLLHVLASHRARLQGDRTEAGRHARKAIALDHRDLYAQRLLFWAQASSSGYPAETEFWLRDRFCPRPFEVFETRPNGDVNTCCNAWMPAPIGNFFEQSKGEIWNSARAREIRRSILDGDFKYCSRLFCPKISGRKLKKRDEVSSEEHKAIIEERQTVLERGPKRVLLSHDRSCNLSCPSCRKTMLVAKKAEQDRLVHLADTVLLPLMGDARLVKVTGSGDPFGSRHFRYVLKRLNRREFPYLMLEIQTNGQLLDRKAWKELELDGLVDSIWISIDAARAKTYEHVRRGGSFSRLLENLKFVAELRSSGRIRSFQLDVVLQKANFAEIPEVVDLGRSLGADKVSFQRIRNWGTFSAAEFAEHDIASSDHPNFGDLLEILCDRRLEGDDVDMGNLRPIYESARQRAQKSQTMTAGSVQDGLVTPHRDVVVTRLLHSSYDNARAGSFDRAITDLKAAVARADAMCPARSEALIGSGHVVMVHMGRCGSTILADLLDQRPDIAWDGEIFTKERGLLGRNGNPLVLVWDRLARRSKSFWGFALKTWQPDEIGLGLEFVLDALNVLGVTRLILLERRNTLRRIISSDLGHISGEWHVPASTAPICRRLSVKLEQPLFSSRVIAHQRLFERAEGAMVDRSHVRLTYEEDVFPDPLRAYEKSCAFLGLEPFHAVTASLARTNPFSLEEIIENFEEFRKSLEDTPYAWMLDAP